MRYVLDTDIFTAYFYEKTSAPEAAPIAKRITTLPKVDVVISVVTVTEVMRGMLNLLQRMEKAGRDTQGFADFERAYQRLHEFPILSFSPEAHALFSAFPPAVRRIGRPYCQIAAIALAANYTVVTRNVRHFAQIPGIVYEDWTRSDMDQTK